MTDIVNQGTICGTPLDTILSNPRHVGLPLCTQHQAAILLHLFQAGKTPAHKLELLNARSAFTAAQLLECGLATAPQRIRDAFGLSVATLVKKAVRLGAVVELDRRAGMYQWSTAVVRAHFYQSGECDRVA